MKIRKNYWLYINPMLATAFYGNDKFGSRISTATFGQLYTCTLFQLKQNLKRLSSTGFSVYKRNY